MISALEIELAIAGCRKLPRRTVRALDDETKAAYFASRRRAWNASYIQKIDPEVRKARQRANVRRYYARNRERVLAMQSARRAPRKTPRVLLSNEERRARRSARQKRWAAANRDKVRAAQTKHIKKVGGRRTWEENNQDRVREFKRQSAKRYYRKNTERCKARSIEAMHLRRAIGPGLKPHEWREILASHNGMCAYCKTRPGVTRDHVVPVSRGGSHAPDNIVPACKRCNSSKNNRLLSEWTRRPA